MKKVGLTAHMMVKNEEQWIWFAINSILPFMDELIIFDTGSTDKTKKIITSFKTKKIIFKEKESTERADLVSLRNQMITETKTDWFLLVDGDEVWPTPAIKELTDAISKASQNTWGIVTRTRNSVGDIWHYQPEAAGKYELLGRKGHLTIRAYRKIGGFKWQGLYPNEAYTRPQGKPIQDYQEHLQFIDVAYWHLTHLARSKKSHEVIDRPKKLKHEIGIKAQKHELPEVFFSQRPSFVPNPFKKPNIFYKLLALILTPLKIIKRSIAK